MKTTAAVALALALAPVPALITGCGEATAPAHTAVMINIFGVDGNLAGHGSGVNLGNGIILTAGHVSEGAKEISIETDDALVHKAEILWVNHAFDVSLAYSDDLKNAPGADLQCGKTYVGQDVTIVGNPGPTEFAQTWGKVSGFGKTGYENLDKGLWRELVTLNITTAPGVSGGPVYDDFGGVVGILVSGLIIPDRGTFGYSYMVPSTAICHLLGRA